MRCVAYILRQSGIGVSCGGYDLNKNGKRDIGEFAVVYIDKYQLVGLLCALHSHRELLPFVLPFLQG